MNFPKDGSMFNRKFPMIPDAVWKLAGIPSKTYLNDKFDDVNGTYDW